MLFLLFACTAEKNFDTAQIDTTIDTDTNTDTNTDESCFASTPQEPYLVYATPYRADGSPVSDWIFLPKSGTAQNFSMGRATIGEVSISSDGSWGVVPQQDGSVGVFQVQEGTLVVLQESLILTTANQDIYTSQVWLDSQNGRLWITDSNWPNNGGGLFVADIDCETGQIAIAEDVFRSKNALGAVPFSEDSMIFLSREVNDNAQQITIFNDETYEMIYTAQAFDDDDSIFSSLATDGENILVGDNATFSGIPNRISHLKMSNNALERETIIEVEDPMDMKIYADQALIASGFGDALWQYNLTDYSLTRLSLSPIVELPAAIVQHEADFYTAENTAIRHLRLENGIFVDQGLLVDTTGVEGIIGAIGVFGEH